MNRGVSMNRFEKGRNAEDAAAGYLISQGFRILERNFRWAGGEIDIIAEEQGTLVFVEVRSRQSTSCGLPQETVNYSKQQQVRKTAAFYLKIKGLWEKNCRFDVIGVLCNQEGGIKATELIRDAF